MQILSLGQIISLAKAFKKTIVCSLSCQSLKVTGARFVLTQD
ncbi:hypothetical protein GXM_09559 [Nostoc sphaeroides CCNUC1]|uniref:Uncharacterized protein n=1 Tax=Nostoc sphaeroides CCNUC1 TaxID=2653204 RepID=A0A5P8WGY9_9NOSO|nr:hypothetical protein GXM_09559 [Nostoc sphaeroides CCNUC1]